MEETKTRYYKLIEVKNPMEKSAAYQLELKAYEYEETRKQIGHEILHRHFSTSVMGNSVIYSLLFCCETKPGETKPEY